MVNVASVPQRSPFRYPGGKTWFVPYARQWLKSQSDRPRELVEPFAGGAIIGLTAAFEYLADHVMLVELDEDVATVWETILGDEGLWLAQAIADFNLIEPAIDTLLSIPSPSKREIALQTIVRNRINRGGILAHGAGRLKAGENGKGLQSRWYPETLKRRIVHIHAIRNRFSLVQGDGLDLLRTYIPRRDSVFFIDPPYTAGGKRAGSRLYRYSDIDHQELFEIADSLSGDFLMTYDCTDAVSELAKHHNFDTHAVAMKSTHHARMEELLIGRNLDWLR